MSNTNKKANIWKTSEAHMETYSETHIQTDMETYSETHMETYSETHIITDLKTYWETHIQTKNHNVNRGVTAPNQVIETVAFTSRITM